MKSSSRLIHLLLITSILGQSLVYPWISILPAPPPVLAAESTPAPSPLDPPPTLEQIISPDIQPTPTQIPEVIPEPTPEAIPETPKTLADIQIKLALPFSGDYPVSFGFGETSENEIVKSSLDLFKVMGHTGIDYDLPSGTPVLAADDGVIIKSGDGEFGTMVTIQHSWGTSYYGHLSTLTSPLTNIVKTGDIIGHSGSSGIATAPHLHFAIQPNKPSYSNGFLGFIDPADYLISNDQAKVLGDADDSKITTRKERKLMHKFSLAKRSLEYDESSLTLNFVTPESTDLEITLTGPRGEKIDLTPSVLGDLVGPLGPSLTFNLSDSLTLTPGQYQLTVIDDQGNYDTQDFTWGVLAVNTNKSIYLPGFPVDFSMAVLDNQGDMVCDAKVSLKIRAPSGLVTTLSSEAGEIPVNLVTCMSKKYTLTPDYTAVYHPAEIGDYEIIMSATTKDGTRNIGTNFSVQEKVAFDVERITITRIYPRLDYPVFLRVHAFEDYQGKVEDVLPTNFELIKPEGDTNPAYETTLRGNMQVLTWDVDWKSGGDYVLSYQFNAPDRSPDFYTLGKFKIGSRFEETKLWQLAIDVTTTIILNTSHTILTSGDTWTVPKDWTDSNNTIEVIGGGGAGRSDTAGTAGAGGGGGGAYAKSVNIDLTPGATVDYQIGVGGIPPSVNGGDTFFNRTSGSADTCADTTSACAKGGTGATSATGTAGGLASASYATGTGNAKNDGGTGGTGHTTSDSGGGGGGAGGPNGAGGTGGVGDTDNATDGVGGGGGGNGGGAAGGSGVTSDTVGATGGNGNGGSGGGAGGSGAGGTNGTAGTGGGGGGGADNFSAGNGADGTDFAGSVVGSGGGGGGSGDTTASAGMGGNGGLYGAGGGGGRYGGFGAPGIIVITYNGFTPTNTSWTVPSDWNDSDNTITTIGGGGSGRSSSQGTGNGGGGGGAYSQITNLNSLNPGGTVDYQIGAGGRKTTVASGNGLDGGDTFFNRTSGSADTCADTTSVCAKGGLASTSVTGAAGGASGSSTGTTKFSGGAGGTGSSTADTSGGGGGAGGTAVGQVGGIGSTAATNGGGGGGGGAGGTSSSVGQAGQTTTGGTGGNGPVGTGSGAAGNAGHGGVGTAATGGGGGGGDDVFGGGNGGTGSSTTWGGGGGGGAGDNNSAATSQGYAGHGGNYGGGGGGGSTNGFGAEGAVIISYTPLEISIAGTASGNNGATVRVAVNGNLQSQTTTISASAWTITNVLMPAVNDIITVWVDAATGDNESTAVTKWSSGNITGMVLNDSVTSIGSNQDTSLSITNLNVYDCTEDEDIMYQAASSALNIEGASCAGSTSNTYTSEKLEVLSGDTLTVATSEAVTTYDMTITGTITSSGNSTYNVAHDWTKTGTFTASTSTVNLTGAGGTTQAISGTNTFSTLSATGSSSRTISFPSSVTTTVSTSLTLTGASSNLLTLAPGTAATTWTISAPSTTSVSYVSVSYSTNSGTAFCATNSTNGGNNSGWTISSGASCNTAPDSPTSLAQKTTGDVTIATGDWVSATSIKFTATATDTDNPDTLYLCIEKDVLGVSFSNTEDSCGSGVAYSGSGVAVTHTITSQTDASEYHWQARIKDTAGAYSSWVSYDVNAESARDYGLDTTSPTGGAVYDGTSAGVDTTYSDSSLSVLSANWDSFNSNASGLSLYEYSIGTSIGGTDIKTWTGNSTTTSVTATGLTLASGTLYYFNVRTTDNAGNVSSVVSSNGQLVSPSLSFGLSSYAITFNPLGPGNSYTDTATTTLTTSTNAYNGYVVRAFVNDYLRNGSATIADFSGGTYASPATWSGAETGFGYTSSDTTIQGANKFSTGTLYAPFSQTGPGDIVADHTAVVSGTPISSEQFTIGYKIKAPSTQIAYRYTNSVIYTATAQY